MVRKLGLGLVLTLLGCAGSQPTSIAMPWHGELLYVARGSELHRWAPSQRHGLARTKPTEVPGPCERYLDLEVWEHDLFALCDDGRVFVSCVPEPRDSHCEAEAWDPIPEISGPAIALQRSDHRLLVVGPDDSMRVVAIYDPEATLGDPAPELDRFRGSDRGGPRQLPVATFDGFQPTAAFALGLRRGPYLSAGSWEQGFACSVALRHGRVGDIAVGVHGMELAATIIGPRGREAIAFIHSSGWRTFAGVYDPVSGRRLATPISCGRLSR